MQCFLCRQSITNASEKIILVNASALHSDCYKQILSYTAYARTRIEGINFDLRDMYKFRLTDFFKPKSDKNIQISELNNEIKVLEKRLLDCCEKLKEVYDYWPDYPPDWNDRSSEVKKQRVWCDNCRRKGEDVHHIVPFSRGGSHCSANLRLLCRVCHQTQHAHKIGQSQSDGLNTWSNPFVAKLELITQSLEKGKKLSFVYLDVDGNKTTRTVRPESISGATERIKSFWENHYDERSSRYLVGFCLLRNENRTFNIKRMSGLKIVD